MTYSTERDSDRGSHPPGIQNTEICANCGATIDQSAWHYVGYETADGPGTATEDGDDGRAPAVLFCSMRCYQA